MDVADKRALEKNQRMKIVYQLLLLFFCVGQGSMDLVENPHTEVPCSGPVDTQSTCNINGDSNTNSSNSYKDDNRPVSLDHETLSSGFDAAQKSKAATNSTIAPTNTEDVLQKSFTAESNMIPANITGDIEDASQNSDAFTDSITIPVNITDKTEYILQESDVDVDNIASASGATDNTEDALQKSDAATNNTTSSINPTARTDDTSQIPIAALNTSTFHVNTSDRVRDTLQRYNVTENDTFTSTSSTNKVKEALQRYNISKNISIAPVTTINKTEYNLQPFNTALNVTATPANTSIKTKVVVLKSDPNTPTNLKDRNYKDEYNSSLKQLVVRKCCDIDEYFSKITRQCEMIENATLFNDYVENMYLGDISGGIKHNTGLLKRCPSSGIRPRNLNLEPGIRHVLTNIGHLKDTNSEIEYDHDNYCLEVVTNAPHNVANTKMLAGVCVKFIPKCCKRQQYFDKNLFDCFDRLENMSNYNSLIQDFDHLDAKSTPSTLDVVNFLYSKQMEKYNANQTYIDEKGQLCQYSNYLCFPKSHYCIEHFRKGSSTELHAGAFVYQHFYKCCKENEILTANECLEHSTDYIPSSRLQNLKEVMVPMFDFVNKIQCRHYTKLKQDDNVRWRVGNHGDLVIRDIDNTDISLNSYCIDDSKETLGRRSVEPVAIVCSEHVYNFIQKKVQTKSEGIVLKSDYIGKCCKVGSYLNHSYCITDESVLNLHNEPLLIAANISKIEYTSFPECLSGRWFHWYPFADELKVDFATIGVEQIMTLVSMENGCLIRKSPINNNDYCIDHNLDKDGIIRPGIMVCPVVRDDSNYVIAVLSGTSCVALIATTFFLTSERVRRGSVSLRKINTLTGKNLLSYVISYLMTFLLLGISMTADIGSTTASCRVFATFLIYFPLAAFLWNTAICIEALLLTIRVRISEKLRFLLYSIFAWGVPGIITTIALILDSYKDSLPCSVIIPRIGLYRCFFSDSDAQLLYFYLPMLLSLCANAGCLMSARYVRSAQLKKLEAGCTGQNHQNTRLDATEMQEQQSDSNQNTNENAQKSSKQHSGLRTHQTRNLWIEALKLMAWSGVTWMAEVVSFLISRFMMLSGSWYNYFWYLPSSINALRGVGIFIIVVWTPDNRQKFTNAVGALNPWTNSHPRNNSD